MAAPGAARRPDRIRRTGRLAATLRHEGFWAAVLGRSSIGTVDAADGLRGPATVVFVAVDDACLPRVLDDVRTVARGAFWAVDPVAETSLIERDARYRQLRSVTRGAHA